MSIERSITNGQTNLAHRICAWLRLTVFMTLFIMFHSNTKRALGKAYRQSKGLHTNHSQDITSPNNLVPNDSRLVIYNR